MQAIQRFNTMVSTATVAVMFIVIEYVLPILQAPAIPDAIVQHISFVTKEQIVDGIKLLVTGLMALGTYKLVAVVLVWLINTIRFLKSFVFGPSYVEGTWIGRFRAASGPKWTVEHFEQSLDGVVIRGYAENEDKTQYATWNSMAAAVDSVRGVLTYTYTCDVMGRNTPQQGIGVFQFERKSMEKAPYGMNGYSTDLTDGDRSPNDEIKMSDAIVSREEAMRKARENFR
jgi:hypothetical protein